MEKLKNRLHNGTCEELEKKKKVHKNKSLDLQQSKASLSIDLKNESGFQLCVSKKSDIVQVGWRHSSSNVSMTSVPIFRISFTSAEKEGIGSQKYTRNQAHIKEIRRKQNKFWFYCRRYQKEGQRLWILLESLS